MSWQETLTILGSVCILSVAFGFGKTMGEDIAIEFREAIDTLAKMIWGD